MDHIEIIKVKEYKPEYLQATQRFLSMLTNDQALITEEFFVTLLSSEHSHLFFISCDNCLAGMLTVGTYNSPTGSKAWIEDVVVDSTFRGKGLGKMLMQHAIDFVQSSGITLLMLTSRPSRIIANNLYQSLGFGRKETNVYRMTFKQ